MALLFNQNFTKTVILWMPGCKKYFVSGHCSHHREHPPDYVEAIHWACFPSVSNPKRMGFVFRFSHVFPFSVSKNDKNCGFCQGFINSHGNCCKKKTGRVCISLPQFGGSKPFNSWDFGTRHRIRKGRVFQACCQVLINDLLIIIRLDYTAIRTGWSRYTWVLQVSLLEVLGSSWKMFGITWKKNKAKT